MHELGIINSVIKNCCAIAEEARARKVNKIFLKIGEYSGVSVEALQFAFEVARLDTMAQEASLDVDQVPLLAKCLECGAEFHPESLLIECGHCGSPGRILQGKELLIDRIEID